MSDQDKKGTTRRQLLTGAAAAGVVGAVSAQSEEQSGSSSRAMDKISVASNGEYEKVPLRQDSVSVSAIQSRVRAVDLKNLRKTMRANLDHATQLIDYAQGSAEAWGGERKWGSKRDLICMHEFPIQGFQPWTRKEMQRLAFELPGPETEVIGERAKHYGCYIAFGCYAVEPDWPDHVINMSVIMGPDGNIVSKQWKARNILGLFGSGALIGTTVYDVLDRYVEMYGWDATVPIARTDIGNIAMTAVGIEPMLYLAQALKGAEIIIMTVTGGNNPDSAQAAAKAGRVYTVGVGNSVSPGLAGFAEAAGAKDEGTVIVDPRGNFMSRSANHHEDIVSARIPMADFRATRRMKELPTALLLPILQQYEPTFKPNAFMGDLPATYEEAGEMVRARMGKKGA